MIGANYIYYMTEQEAASEFNDQKMLTTQGEEPDFSLPRLERHTNRPKVRSKAEKRRNSPIFPKLKKTANSHQEIGDPLSKRTLGSERDEFTLQIEEKLRMVLENVQQGEHLDERSEEEEDGDFEAAIQHNRQKLKHRMQKERSHPPMPQSRQAKLSNPNANPNISSKPARSLTRHDNNNNKRFKDVSIDSKFLQKKKEIIAMKNQALEKAKQIAREREETSPPRHSNNSIQLPVRFVTRPQNSPKKSPPKPQKQESSNNLFDNIQTLLENPLKNRAGSPTLKSNPENLRSLELKLHRINEKLGVVDTIESHHKEDVGIANYTAVDWKRFVYTDANNFKCYQDSNFQQEIAKVGRLQEKNQSCLNEYIDHQKILLELAFLKKNESKRH